MLYLRKGAEFDEKIGLGLFVVSLLGLSAPVEAITVVAPIGPEADTTEKHVYEYEADSQNTFVHDYIPGMADVLQYQELESKVVPVLVEDGN